MKDYRRKRTDYYCDDVDVFSTSDRPARALLARIIDLSSTSRRRFYASMRAPLSLLGCLCARALPPLNWSTRTSALITREASIGPAGEEQGRKRERDSRGCDFLFTRAGSDSLKRPRIRSECRRCLCAVLKLCASCGLASASYNFCLFFRTDFRES